MRPLFLLSVLIVSTAHAALEKSVISLEGARKQCDATFFHFAPDADLALVPTVCLDNMVTGGVSAHGKRSLRAIVAPDVEKSGILDPSLVPPTSLSVVVFPKGTAEAITPLAPAPSKVRPEELSAFKNTSSEELPSLSDEPSVLPQDVEWVAGRPVNDALGRVSGILASCNAEQARTTGCEIASMHETPTFELLWHARKKLGPSADYRIPSVDLERAELCKFRRTCAAPPCRPCCPPRPAYYQGRPVNVYNPPSVYVAPATHYSSTQQSQQVSQQRTDVGQSFKNRQEFNVNPNTSSSSNSNSSPRITASPTNTNNANNNNSNTPVFNFSPTINVPTSIASGGSSVRQDQVGNTQSAPAPDAIAQMRAVEDRLYREKEDLARRQTDASAAVDSQRQRTAQIENELEESRRSVRAAEQMKAELDEANRKARADILRLQRDAEAAAKEAEAAAAEMERARKEADRSRETTRQTIKAGLLNQPEVDPSTITGTEKISRLAPAQPVDYRYAFDRTPVKSSEPFNATLPALLASSSGQLEGYSSSYGEKSFFASLGRDLHNREAILTGSGISEGQLAMLVENHRFEQMTYTEYALAGLNRDPWWKQVDADLQGIRSVAALDRQQVTLAKYEGIAPEYIFVVR